MEKKIDIYKHQKKKLKIVIANSKMLCQIIDNKLIDICINS